MSAPLPSNEEELFSRASELPAAERAAYLDQACASDPALRARIEALLRADRSGPQLHRGTARRRVALKVIKLGMDTKEVIARFFTRAFRIERRNRHASQTRPPPHDSINLRDFDARNGAICRSARTRG